MGANQSSNAEIKKTKKTCYYELLEIDKNASQEEIKKSYRRLALKLHPDRNYGNVEECTKKFTEIQSAYEVLSDVDERAWYDSHREQILNPDSNNSHSSNDYQDSNNNNNYSITTEDLLELFNPSLFANKNLNDENGFYSIATRIFNEIAKDELKDSSLLNEPTNDLPSFGDSNSEWNPTVKNFYSKWCSFKTKKSFSYKDKYHIPSAPDRRTRREMEKQNKRLRDKAQKEYSDTVRSLAKFIKKRDPRCVHNLNNNSYDEQRKAMINNSKEQSKRDRAKNIQSLKDKMNDIPLWAQVDLDAEYDEDGYFVKSLSPSNLNSEANSDISDNDEQSKDDYNNNEEIDNSENYNEFNDHNDFNESNENNEYNEYNDSEENDLEDFSCVVCNKFFKSNGQLTSHLKSNKHKKALSALRRQMIREDRELGLHSEFDIYQTDAQSFKPNADDNKNDIGDMINDSNKNDIDDMINNSNKSDNENNIENHKKIPDINLVNKQLDEDTFELSDIKTSLEHIENDLGYQSNENEEKVKLKQNRKKKKNQTVLNEFNCLVCSENFPTRNKLFDHLKVSGHATLKSEKKQKKQKKKK